MGPHVIEERKDFLKEISFEEYVRHFYDLKSRAEKGSKQYIFAKLFLNSLYMAIAEKGDGLLLAMQPSLKWLELSTKRLLQKCENRG